MDLLFRKRYNAAFTGPKSNAPSSQLVNEPYLRTARLVVVKQSPLHSIMLYSCLRNVGIPSSYPLYPYSFYVQNSGGTCSNFKISCKEKKILVVLYPSKVRQAILCWCSALGLTSHTYPTHDSFVRQVFHSPHFASDKFD